MYSFRIVANRKSQFWFLSLYICAERLVNLWNTTNYQISFIGRLLTQKFDLELFPWPLDISWKKCQHEKLDLCHVFFWSQPICLLIISALKCFQS